MVGPFRQRSQRRQAAHGEFCSPAAKLPSVAEHSDEGYEDATTDMPRLPCLPSAATVQSRADAALAERSVCFTQGFVVVFAVILSASLFVSSSRALEQIGNVAFPLCVLLISAAVWPGAPSEMGKAYLLRLAALGALGGGRVAYARYVESGDRSIFEGTVKVVVAVQFSVALACVVIVCSCLHARHTWTVHRVALIFANSVRAAAVLLLRYGSPEPAIVYPPDLPFGCALFTSVLWIILLGAASPARRAWFARVTGGDLITFHLREIGSRKGHDPLGQDGAATPLPRTPLTAKKGTTVGGLESTTIASRLETACRAAELRDSGRGQPKAPLRTCSMRSTDSSTSTASDDNCAMSQLELAIKLERQARDLCEANRLARQELDGMRLLLARQAASNLVAARVCRVHPTPARK